MKLPSVVEKKLDDAWEAYFKATVAALDVLTEPELAAYAKNVVGSLHSNAGSPTLRAAEFRCDAARHILTARAMLAQMPKKA